MARPVDAAPAQGGTGPLALLKRKVGPFPVWAYGLILIGLVVLYRWWQNRNGASAATAATTGDGTPLPGNQTPGPIFIVPGATPPPINVTVPAQPLPPGNAPTVPTAPPSAGAPPPTTTPPAATSPTGSGKYETVTKYTKANTDWRSTIWGIWNHYRTTSNWQAIWNDPMNADLRNKRGTPQRVKPGDRVWVPGAS
jgi:hypothetical protein